MATITNDTQPTMPSAEAERSSPGSALEWGVFLSHLQDGYRNAQETIRAMDTKVNILTGLSVFALTAVGGILGAATGCFGDHPEYFQAITTAPILLLVVVGLLVTSTAVSLVLGIVCILSCLDTLRAHSRIDLFTGLPTTVLFPHLPPRGKLTHDEWLGTHGSTMEYYARIAAQNFTSTDMQKEYHDQILNVGAILGSKVDHFGQASLWFRRQIILTGCVLGLLLTTIVGIGITGMTTAASKGKAVAAKPVDEPNHPEMRQAP